MYEPSELIGDPDNLTGLLFLTAREAGTRVQYYSIFSTDKERLKSLNGFLPSGLEELIREDVGVFIEPLNIQVEQSEHHTAVTVYGVGGLLNNTIPFNRSRIGDVNTYDLGVVKDDDEFLDKSAEVIFGYFPLYYSQQEAKKDQETCINKLTVYDIAAKDMLHELLKLSVGMMSAVRDEEPIAQLEAEDRLREFASGNALSYNTEEIIRLAHYMGVGKSEAVTTHCRIIKAIVKEDFELAGSLQRHVERLQQNMQIPA